MGINWRFWRTTHSQDVRSPHELPESSIEKKVHFRVVAIFAFFVLLWYLLIESVRRLQIKRMTDEPMYLNPQQINSKYFRPLFTPDQQLVVLDDSRSSDSLSEARSGKHSKWFARSRLTSIK